MIPTKPRKSTKDTPCSDLQKLAQKENFALYVLKGMRANTIHLQSILGMGELYFIRAELDLAIADIKETQNKRKESRK